MSSVGVHSTSVAAPLLVPGPSFLLRNSSTNHHAPQCAYSVFRCAGGGLSPSTMRGSTGRRSTANGMPYASAFMAPPALPMYMPIYVPRPPAQQASMQAKLEELARQRHDLEARELEVKRRTQFKCH